MLLAAKVGGGPAMLLAVDLAPPRQSDTSRRSSWPALKWSPEKSSVTDLPVCSS